MRSSSGRGAKASLASRVAATFATAWAVAAGCNPYGSDAASSPSAPPEDAATSDAGASDASDEVPAPDPTAECRAQRVVHLVASNGGLAWFTHVWPVPAVITGFQSTYAYDDPNLAVLVNTDPAHPLYARSTQRGGGIHALWQTAAGSAPTPTVIVEGVNQTHTAIPQETTLVSGTNVLGAAALAQASLAAPMPVLVLGAPAGVYAPVGGAPTQTSRRTSTPPSPRCAST